MTCSIATCILSAQAGEALPVAPTLFPDVVGHAAAAEMAGHAQPARKQGLRGGNTINRPLSCRVHAIVGGSRPQGESRRVWGRTGANGHPHSAALAHEPILVVANRRESEHSSGH